MRNERFESRPSPAAHKRRGTEIGRAPVTAPRVLPNFNKQYLKALRAAELAAWEAWDRRPGRWTP